MNEGQRSSAKLNEVATRDERRYGYLVRTEGLGARVMQGYLDTGTVDSIERSKHTYQSVSCSTYIPSNETAPRVELGSIEWSQALKGAWGCVEKASSDGECREQSRNESRTRLRSGGGRERGSRDRRRLPNGRGCHDIHDSVHNVYVLLVIASVL